MEEHILKIINQTLNHLKKIKKIDLDNIPELLIEKPKREEYGDLATNVAFILAPSLKKSLYK